VHSAAVLRLTGTERGVAEVAAVAEHVASLTSTSAAFGLSPDVPHIGPDGVATVPLLDETSAGDGAATLAEIRNWAKESLGIEHIPAVWRALAHLPRLLESTWRKDRLVLSAGVLDELVKGCAALAVAQFRQSAYCITYLTQFLRTRCGLGDRGVVELAGAVMHYVSFNTIAHGMMLEPPFVDVRAIDFLRGGRLVDAPGPGAPPPSGNPNSQ
jgi:hypothetical protein